MKSLLFSMFFLFFQVSFAAEKIITFEFIQAFTTENLKPFVIINNNNLEGLFGDFLKESSRGTINKMKVNNFPWPKTQNELRKSVNSIIFPLAKTPEREKNYKWIYKLIDDPVCFYTLAGNKPINNTEEAKKLRSVGYLKNGSESNLIQTFPKKIKKVDSLDIESLVQKLYQKKLDTIVGGSYIKYYWKISQYNPSLLLCGKSIKTNELYFATSKNSEDKFVKVMNKEMEKFKNSPHYKKIEEKYRF